MDPAVCKGESEVSQGGHAAAAQQLHGPHGSTPSVMCMLLGSCTLCGACSCDVRLRCACYAMQRSLTCQPPPTLVMWCATATRTRRPRSSQPSIAPATPKVIKAARIALTMGHGVYSTSTFFGPLVHHERQAHPPGRKPSNVCIQLFVAGTWLLTLHGFLYPGAVQACRPCASAA